MANETPTPEQAPEQAPEGSVETSPQRAPASMPALTPDPQTKFSDALSQGQAAAPFGPTNTGTPIPLDVYAQKAEQDSGWQAEHGPRPNRWNVYTGAASRSLEDSWGGSLLRLWQERALSQGPPPISADSANKLFPDRETPYTTPVDPRIVGMEQGWAQARKQQDAWLSQAPQGWMTSAAGFAGSLTGGLMSPENLAVGALSGGIADILAPAEVPALGKLAIHYLSMWGGFTEQEALSNFIEHKMGARQKELPELAQGAALPAAFATGVDLTLRAFARRFADSSSNDVNVDAVKRGAIALYRNESLPSYEEHARVVDQRNRGMTALPAPQLALQAPTLVTSPLEESRLYGGVHPDGAPHVFEHGLGPGLSTTDTVEAANHSVAKSGAAPGHVGDIKLPEGTKLLDLDQSAKLDYEVPDEKSFLKEAEKKLGVPLESLVENGATLKDVIQMLGDHAGHEDVPPDVLSQLQQVARSQGYSGYGLSSGPGDSSRIAHLFDPENNPLDNIRAANPQGTPDVPTSPSAQVPPSPEQVKTGQKLYSPDIEQMLREEHAKSEYYHPYSDKALADVQTELDTQKQQLTELARTSDTAKEMLDSLREEEAKDARLRDMAKRIADCGSGGS